MAPRCNIYVFKNIQIPKTLYTHIGNLARQQNVSVEKMIVRLIEKAIDTNLLDTFADIYDIRTQFNPKKFTTYTNILHARFQEFQAQYTKRFTLLISAFSKHAKILCQVSRTKEWVRLIKNEIEVLTFLLRHKQSGIYTQTIVCSEEMVSLKPLTVDRGLWYWIGNSGQTQAETLTDMLMRILTKTQHNVFQYICTRLADNVYCTLQAFVTSGIAKRTFRECSTFWHVLLESASADRIRTEECILTWVRDEYIQIIDLYTKGECDTLDTRLRNVYEILR